MHVELVRADGCSDTVTANPGETILDAAERANVTIPFGCRTGACSTCTGKLEVGRAQPVRLPRALKEHQLREGFVLTCIAAATTDCRIIIGPEVQAELVKNPWK